MCCCLRHTCQLSKKNMSAFIAALLVLTATSQVMVSACRLEQQHVVQCYGALGKSVIIHLGIDTNDVQIKMKTGERNILTYKNGIIAHSQHANHSWSIYNGTLKWGRALKNDSEEYTVEVFNKGGRLQLFRKIKLIIQAPLSKAIISQLCLPHGEIRASCSSDGDVTEYNWTLRDRPLDTGLAYLTEEMDTVILRKNVSGNITCSVQNHFSSTFTTVQLSACSAPRICTLPNKAEVAVSVRATETFQSLLIIRQDFSSVGERENISAVCSITSLSPDLGNEENINQHSDKGATCVGIVTVSVAICAVITVFALTTTTYCLSRKRNRTGVTAEGDKNTQELVYTEALCLNRAKGAGRLEKEPEPRVIYGQIKVPDEPEHSKRRAHGQEDAVYTRLKKKKKKRKTANYRGDDIHRISQSK
ncbi:uncharacterized protein LOC133133751 isoform X1 [Conger conger]|uniref:uncharacterized protein LOC133133751 isoform X1 n=1 Tax=Conger conger TaxID=82655 RepID=UPI002A5A26AA|nr:uncharacterized protein LOC133133751 isoform X1 [Conger conger]